jgi:hypothetical protein
MRKFSFDVWTDKMIKWWTGMLDRKYCLSFTRYPHLIDMNTTTQYFNVPVAPTDIWEGIFTNAIKSLYRCTKFDGCTDMSPSFFLYFVYTCL